ncbi:MAG: prepilin-type N-terminal cleavage/methylation domain-containing protein [Epsilonproteobacteria bacterium]|nr:prepilin-type N-terminal cleavage/methylation domain-containing protein [Campylobacterota bacterium]
MLNHTLDRKGFRKGFTMTELAFVLVIGGLVITVGLMAFNKMYSPTVANNEYSKAMQVMGAVERAAGDSGGTYPAYNAGTMIPAATAVSNQMGGNTRDVAGWQYGCPAAATTATITTNTLSSTTVASLLATKINGSSPNWAATPAGSVVTITKNNILCQ